MKLKLIAASLFLVLGASCAEAPEPKTENPDVIGVGNGTEVENGAEIGATVAAVEVSVIETLSDQNQRFDAFKDNFLNKTWELDPSFAVYVGFYKYDDILVVPNGEHRALQREFYATELQALKQFDARNDQPA